MGDTFPAPRRQEALGPGGASQVVDMGRGQRGASPSPPAPEGPKPAGWAARQGHASRCLTKNGTKGLLLP